MEKKVEFKVGKETLRGSLFIPSGKGPFPGVVFYHGRGSSRKNYLPMAKKLSNNGIIGLAFDFGGCGESDGVFKDQTQRMGIDDAKAGLEFLLSQNVDRNRIGVMGSSFGGFVAAIIIPEFEFIKSMILRVPAVYPDELLDINVGLIKDYYHIEKEKWLSSIAYDGISKFKGNLLVIQSEKDDVVKDWIVKNYYDRAENAAKRELFVQKGAGHSLHATPDLLKEFYKLTFDWFLETL